MVSKKSKKKKRKKKDFLFFFNFSQLGTDMVLGKKVAIFSIGNGSEIWPLEKGRKCPVSMYLPCFADNTKRIRLKMSVLITGSIPF